MRDTRTVTDQQVWVVTYDSTGEGKGARVPVTLSYDKTNPYAVTLDFADQQTWVIARSLLREGRYAPTGDGDVHIKPSQLTSRVDITVRGFDESDGPHSVCFSASTSRLTAFIAQTTRLVPIGSESAVMGAQMDELIMALLTEEA